MGGCRTKERKNKRNLQFFYRRFVTASFADFVCCGSDNDMERVYYNRNADYFTEYDSKPFKNAHEPYFMARFDKELPCTS